MPTMYINPETAELASLTPAEAKKLQGWVPAKEYILGLRSKLACATAALEILSTAGDAVRESLKGKRVNDYSSGYLSSSDHTKRVAISALTFIK